MKGSLGVISSMVAYVACYGVRSEPSMTKPNLDGRGIADKIVRYSGSKAYCKSNTGKCMVTYDSIMASYADPLMYCCDYTCVQCGHFDYCENLSLASTNWLTNVQYCKSMFEWEDNKGCGVYWPECGPYYWQNQNKHCSSDKYGNYKSVEDAKAACTGDSNCGSVYDQGCDSPMFTSSLMFTSSTKNVYLCPMGASIYNSSSSCIYKKAENYDLKAANDLCSDAGTIDNKSECKFQAIWLLKRYGVDAVFKRGINQASWPKGCFKAKATSGVFWNDHSSGNAHNSAQPICKLSTLTFSIRTSGSCWDSRIVRSKDECEQAAISLGLDDTTAYADQFSGRPYGCVYKRTGWLGWNSPDDSPYESVDCGSRYGSSNYDCICRKWSE